MRWAPWTLAWTAAAYLGAPPLPPAIAAGRHGEIRGYEPAGRVPAASRRPDTRSPAAPTPGLLLAGAGLCCGAAALRRQARPRSFPTARRARAPRLAEAGADEKTGFAIPFFQAKVPADQQPTAELRELQRGLFFDWAAKDDAKYKEKLGSLYQFLMLFLSLPIAYVTYNRLPSELPQLLLSANIGTLAVMLLFVFRLRVGYGQVGQRLREKETYYEAQERGLFARKDRETRLRDRLVEKAQVAPARRRIDASIFSIVLGLALSLGGGEVLTVVEGEAGPATLKPLIGDEARRFDLRLKSDPEFAKREQDRQLRRQNEDGTGVKPLYCESRYYRILAGSNAQGGVGCGGE